MGYVVDADTVIIAYKASLPIILIGSGWGYMKDLSFRSLPFYLKVSIVLCIFTSISLVAFSVVLFISSFFGCVDPSLTDIERGQLFTFAIGFIFGIACLVLAGILIFTLDEVNELRKSPEESGDK